MPKNQPEVPTSAAPEPERRPVDLPPAPETVRASHRVKTAAEENPPSPFPAIVEFKSIGVREGLSFRAGIHNVVRGHLRVRIPSAEVYNSVVRGLAEFLVVPVEGEVAVESLPKQESHGIADADLPGEVA